MTNPNVIPVHRVCWLRTALTSARLSAVACGEPAAGDCRTAASVSEIEFRSPENTAVPLVKMYSRRQVRNLFKRFADLDLKTCHANNDQLTASLRWLLGGLSEAEFERRFHRFGWYLIARAQKPR